MENNKEITIEGLARIIKDGFKETDKRIAVKFAEADKQTDEKIEKLARMVQQGFEETAKKADLQKVERQVADLGNKVTQIDKRLFSLEEDIADMKLKKYKDLPERVSFLERKLGVAK